MLKKNLFLLIFLFLTKCIFDINVPPEPLKIKLLTSDSIVSPSPCLRFAASSALADSSVIEFNFYPPISAQYFISLNNTKDTITLEFLEFLEGNTKYIITFKKPLYSVDGAVLLAVKDSFFIKTGFKEHEPNNNFILADTLFSYIYGKISNASDTDVYYIPFIATKGFYLKSYDFRDTFLIYDSTKVQLSSISKATLEDTIVILDEIKFPIFIKIFSCISGSTGKYLLGSLDK
jgi:hypothetical protein